MLSAWDWTFPLLMLAVVEAVVIAAQQVAIHERWKLLQRAAKEFEIQRQEIQVLTDALARGNRTPVIRERKGPLRPSETWFEGQPRISKITPN